ncbi:Uncharacterised protein [uncultured archaeon]|nr:Uncharacterised protein [uncultured archaeon]
MQPTKVHTVVAYTSSAPVVDHPAFRVLHRMKRIMAVVDTTLFAQCTTCHLQNHGGITATHIATAPNKMQWYECPNHEDWEHADAMTAYDDEGKVNIDPMEVRCSLVPLEDWRKANKIL